MKRVIFLLVALLLVCSTVPVSADNGAPNGAHYNLNIIGVPKGKTADMTGDNGHRIFVPETGSAKIMLSDSGDATTFQVTDANGTDSNGAAFSLPMPADCFAAVDPVTGDVTTPASCTVRYTVWIRLLGKPGGSMNMYTCAQDPDLPGGYICSDPTWWVELTRSKGKSTFTNISKELLFLSADVDADGAVEHVQLFDPLFDQYYWQYNNNGVKLAQLRFYMGDYTITW